MSRYLTACLLVVFTSTPLYALSINVPNGDFNDNSDNDLTLIGMGWDDGDGSNANLVEQVDNAAGKSSGDLVMRLGGANGLGGTGFIRPTVDTGAQFDSTAAAYLVTVEVRAFTDLALTDSTGALMDNNDWGFLIRDLTNNNNIKEVRPVSNENWETRSLLLTQSELLAYETSEGIDVDVANIGIRFYRTTQGSNTGFVTAVDNLTLDALDFISDLSGNGTVGQEDYAVIRDNLFLTNASYLDGDLDSSGAVDLLDFRIWKDEFLAGGGTPAQLQAILSAVPEPMTSSLLILGLLPLAATRSARKG